MGTIKIRNVPDDLYAWVKAQADAEGISIPAFLRRELLLIARMPPRGGGGEGSDGSTSRPLEHDSPGSPNR